ncbi:REP element-mobilizing transposase RayT [Flavobacterium sp. CG_9.10]|uniref:transposase n=1 Tax=Flavobacterium sp. CG_9.10 TaxID=2787729 RepID=UPI0018CB4AC5|nr:transposase [Flavobacterium sp. CG_9.10]MBG6109177.1 REP element-mobilizing transposase RayT [Flavobacterium sp. CG_9.10]
MELEVLEKDNYYHIYNRGINGTAIFFNEENKNFFLKQLSKYLVDKISMIAYCLMDNHFHLVIKVNEDGEVVTQGFSNFFNSYVKSINKQNDRTGSLFEKHFKRIRLENEWYLRNLIIYVHLNPKHHLDLKFEEFKFSSYQSFLSQKETKLQREEVLNLFGGIQNFIFCHNQKSDLLTEKYTFE